MPAPKRRRRKPAPTTSSSRKRRGPKRKAAPRRGGGAVPLVIVTGMSGSGKSLVLRTFEDAGYYCVDNLPLELLPNFAELYLSSGGEIARAALGIDSREGPALRKLPQMFRRLRRELPATLLFVEASEDALIRRFSETRRPHPLGRGLSLRAGIRRERALLRQIRELAGVVVDTTRYSPHELRRFVEDRFGGAGRATPLAVTVVSFGYRYGVPSDADLVFDARFLPNPYFVPAYRKRTGRDKRVAQFVLGFPESRAFLDKVAGLLDFLIPNYVREGKTYLTLGIGCTGGRHRSVVIAEAVARRLSRTGTKARLLHRDVTKGR